MKFREAIKKVQGLMAGGMSQKEAKASVKAVAMVNGDPILDADGNELDITGIMLVTDDGTPVDENAKREDETDEEKAKREDEEEPKRKQEEEDDDKPEEDKALANISMKDLEAMIGKAVGKQAKTDKAAATDKTNKTMSVYVTGGGPRNDLAAKTAGFDEFSDMLIAVKNWCLDPTNLDVRLKSCVTRKAGWQGDIRSKSTPTNVSTGQIGADGGFAIAPQFLAELINHAFNESSLMARCRQLNTSGNNLEIPKDETVAWGTDGVQVNWTGENNVITDTKLKIGTIDVKLHKLAALVPMSNELLEDDAVSLDTYVNQTVPDRLRYAVDDAILNGSGAGQPLGIRNSGALKTVTRVTGTGIAIDEIADLMSAQPSWSLSRADFVSHTTVLTDLIKTQIGNFPVFMAPGDLETKGLPGRLMGRPLIVHEAAQARDNAGDLALHDFSQYIVVTKTANGGIRGMMSIHLYFDRDVSAFRFIMRIGGQPWLTSVITQDNGGGTISPFSEIGPT